METFLVSIVSLRYICTPIMKEKIIQHASALFLKLGFKSVTMDDIADDMGISKKTIYIHFKNKTALVKQCTFSVLERILDGIDAICSQYQDPIDELFEVKKFIMEQLQNDQTSPQYQLKKYYPEINHSLQQSHFNKMLECTKRNISKGIEQGVYRPNLDPDFIARIYFVGMTNIKDRKIFPIKKYSSKYVTDEFLEYHIRGIVTPKGLLSLNKYINEKQVDEA